MQTLKVYERTRSLSDSYTLVNVVAEECSEKEKDKIVDAYLACVDKFENKFKAAEIEVRSDCAKITTEIVEEPLKGTIKDVSVTRAPVAAALESSAYDIKIWLKTRNDEAMGGVRDLVKVLRVMYDKSSH